MTLEQRARMIADLPDGLAFLGDIRPALESFALRHLREAVDEAGWQPIETAPKDGRYILVFGRHFRSCRQANGSQMVVRWDSVTWESADDGYGAYIEPTHWMPLPAPPVDEALKRAGEVEK